MHINNKQSGQPGNVWPEYFQPRTGQEPVVADKEDSRIATSLLDIFYLSSTDSDPASLVAVVGCLGGDIDVVSGENFDRLTDDVKEQIQFLEINQRNRFRLIVARNIDIFRLDALRLSVSGQGFNRAVQLFGSMQARISRDHDKTSIILVANEGRIVIGKLDFLQAIRKGIAHPLIHVGAAAKKTFHILIAAGRPLEAQQGRSLALIYPLPDPDIGDVADNELVVRQVAYELLLSLQSAMLESGIRSPFTENRLPVPNRAQSLEHLKADGYEIRGNAAFKTDANRKPPSATFLGQLRQSAESWFAPVVGLPYEATLDDYAVLIDEGLSHVATNEDQEAMDAVSARTLDSFVPSAERNATPPLQPRLARQAAPVQPAVTPPGMRPKSTALPPAGATAPADWDDDFTVMPRQSKPEASSHRHWWDDFADDDDAGSTVTMTMHDALANTRQIETDDVRDGASPLQPPGNLESGPNVSPTRQPEYASDFREFGSRRDEKDPVADPEWENDFR